MNKHLPFRFCFLVLGLLALAFPVFAQDEATPEATEQAYDPAACFRAADTSDRMVSFPAKEGPYTIGISNSFIGNAWRTQMIQMAQAFAQQEDVAPMIEDLIVVSSGQDVEAQISQMDNMIALGV